MKPPEEWERALGVLFTSVTYPNRGNCYANVGQLQGAFLILPFYVIICIRSVLS